MIKNVHYAEVEEGFYKYQFGQSGTERMVLKSPTMIVELFLSLKL